MRQQRLRDDRTKRRQRVEMVSACINAAGAPDFALTTVTLTEEEYDLGQAYDRVEDDLRARGYECPFVHFEKGEAPAFLFPVVRRYLSADSRRTSSSR